LIGANNGEEFRTGVNHMPGEIGLENFPPILRGDQEIEFSFDGNAKRSISGLASGKREGKVEKVANLINKRVVTRSGFERKVAEAEKSKEEDERT
jgi:hypothetical protein